MKYGVACYQYRDNTVLKGDGKLFAGKTKKDIKLSAVNFALQNSWRLVDIVYNDSELFQSYKELVH